MKIIDCGDYIVSENGKHFVYFVCLLRATNGEVIPGEELTKLGWFSKDKILDEDIELGFRKMIEKYLPASIEYI